jgi:hypothetical protein
VLKIRPITLDHLICIVHIYTSMCHMARGCRSGTQSAESSQPAPKPATSSYQIPYSNGECLPKPVSVCGKSSHHRPHSPSHGRFFPRSESDQKSGPDEDPRPDITKEIFLYLIPDSNPTGNPYPIPDLTRTLL